MSNQQRVRTIETVLVSHVADILQTAHSCTVPGGRVVVQLHADFWWVRARCVAAGIVIPNLGPGDDIFVELKGSPVSKMTEPGVRIAIADRVDRGFLHMPSKRCTKGIGRVFGVSEYLGCHETGILRRLLRRSRLGVSQHIPCETPSWAVKAWNRPVICLPRRRKQPTAPL